MQLSETIAPAGTIAARDCEITNLIRQGWAAQDIADAYGAPVADVLDRLTEL